VTVVEIFLFNCLVHVSQELKRICSYVGIVTAISVSLLFIYETQYVKPSLIVSYMCADTLFFWKYM